MQFLHKLEKTKDTWFVVIVSFFFVLLRIPSLFEPLWYGDEGVYETVGMGLLQGRLLYRDIWDNKPPLLYVLYALLQSSQPLVRLANLLAGLVSVILFFFISRRLFTQKHVQYLTTSVFALLLAIPFLEGNIANAENFMMPLILGAALLTLHVIGKVHTQKNFTISSFIHNTKYAILLLSGLLLGTAFLFKVVAIFDLGAFTIFLLLSQIKQITKQYLTAVFFELIPLYLGFIIPFLCTVVYFMANHALSEFIHSAFLTNVDYVNYANQITIPLAHLVIPQGLLLIKCVLLVAFIVFLFMKRQQIPLPAIFVASWFSFSLFNALFSQRPYTHYLLVLLASFCLLLGFVLQKKKTQLISLAIVLLVVMYFGTHFSFFKKNVAYYQNFLAFVKGNESIQKYRAFFDQSTPRDYELADFLLTQIQKHDTIFLWGNNAQLYALTDTLPPGRYTVAYHITMNQQSLTETARAIASKQPHFVIIMPNAGNFPYRLTNYSQDLTINQAVIYERNNF